MGSLWPIRTKLITGTVLLSVIVGTLALLGIWSAYSYRGLARSVSARAVELPLGTRLLQRVSDLRVTLRQIQDTSLYTICPERQSSDRQILREEFRSHLIEVDDALTQYRRKLDEAVGTKQQQLDDVGPEQAVLRQLEVALGGIRRYDQSEAWVYDAEQLDQLDRELENLYELSAELPSHLHNRMQSFAGNVRTRYRTWIILSWITAVAAGILLLILIRQFYHWIFRPLKDLIQGSREIASGQFDHRIHLDSKDEMAELAAAMNGMTERFQQIRANLDNQVEIRTRQAIRSEQLAGVGFLAAGVAHEINNPLASIALGAEGLHSRLEELCGEADHPEMQVMRQYLQMIQKEAFRCKGITEKLLDFSRLSESRRERTELSELVAGVVEMVGHIDKYKNARIVFQPQQPVFASVNPQEIKQVMLNLITNALNSLGPDGTVRLEVCGNRDQAVLVVADDGCGMTEEVRRHLFEPFFTQSRDGKGTGLGLSITHRIIDDHGGHIDAQSAGPGRGSTFRVILPLSNHEQKSESSDRRAA